MAEIKVTYETLFDLLRREKGRGELQQLDQTFYEDVTEYINEKNKTLNMSSSRGEREKIQIQLKNVKKILRELYELREKKIIALATSKVKTSSSLIDTSKLLGKEKELFNDACDLFSKYKEEVLERVISDSRRYEEKFDDRRYEEKKYAPKTETKEEPQEVEEESGEEPQQDQVQEDGIIKIKILNNLPRFLGIDKKIYGPYSKGDETEMPLETAKLLLDKKRAEKI